MKITSILLFILICIWQLQPVSYDVKKIDKRLSGLKEPFKSVVVEHYFDGGSIGIEIIDKLGEKCDIFIDASMDSSYPKYSRISVSGKNIKNVEETKKMLEYFLKKYTEDEELRPVRTGFRHIVNVAYDFIFN